MDYTEATLSFRIRKVWRYLRLYGFTRTLNKVRSAYHMKKEYPELPIIAPRNNRGHVGMIGCGNFAYSTVAHYLKRNYGNVLRGTMDVDVTRAASLCETFKANYYTDDAARVIEDEAIDLVYIASNHASHAEYAIRALNSNKSVHIEKPPVVSDDQLRRLCLAMEASTGAVGLGYNRPRSKIGERIQSALDRESGPTMINWFIAAHELKDDHWYFKPEEGGRVLGNLCHWIDYSLSLIPVGSRFPVKITPATSKNYSSDFIVSFEFADSSLAVISMSSKGHTFEGVSERLSVHKGNTLVSMTDFSRLIVKRLHETSTMSPLFRDHGHEAAIIDSYENVKRGKGFSTSEVWESANLMLRTREAVETGKVVTAHAFDNRSLVQGASSS